MDRDAEVREQAAMDEVTNRLANAYQESYSSSAVAETVTQIHHRFDGRPIRDFVPVLVERLARQELSRSIDAA